MAKTLFDFDVSEDIDGKNVRRYIPHLYPIGQLKLLIKPNNYMRHFFLGCFHAAVV